jgi:type VI secretion system protein ImpC
VAPSAKQAELIAKVDDATSDQMRALLASPEFKQLEATWKGLDFLVRRLETGEQLKIFVADVTKEEVVSDLRASEELGESGTYHLIVDRTVGTPGSKLWSALAGIYEFEDSVEDIEALGRMARLAALAGAPFLAGGTAHLAGVEAIHENPDPDDWDRPLAADVEAAWKALRRLPEARYLAVALPRFLTRLPYGKKSNPAERFQFEEMPNGSQHEAYCWACSSILCAAALARGFEELGWNLRPAGAVDLDGLPMHVYKEDGESVVKPCAEVLLVDRAADRITDAGLVPIQSFKGGDTVRVRGITAVASPTTPIAGRWSH